MTQATLTNTDCNHTAAKCIDSTEPKEEGRFTEHYECACGATGTIQGREEQPPHEWTRTGEVFN